MMSSETSTDTLTFRPWHLFTVAGLLVASIGIVLIRPADVATLVLLVAAILASAAVGLGVYRTIWPLADREFHDRVELIAGRTRASLEREKTLALRSLKELEFDHAMGKVSDLDFKRMSEKLRARAIALMKQLDVDTPALREQIEYDLAERLKLVSGELVTSDGEARSVCAGCGAGNEDDAKFCKGCGALLQAQEGVESPE